MNNREWLLKSLEIRKEDVQRELSVWSLMVKCYKEDGH